MINSITPTDIIRIKAISYSLYLENDGHLSFDNFIDSKDYKKYYKVSLREYKLKRILNDN